MSDNGNEKIRISKRLSELGLCSRREADEFISRGLVRVDGQIVSELGTKIHRNQRVDLLPQALRIQNQAVTIVLNKPIGYVSNQPEDGHPPAIDLITNANRDAHYPGRELKSRDFDHLAAAGRLDIDSQGILVFTQSGPIAKQLVGADSNLDKEYLVRVRKSNVLEEDHLDDIVDQLSFGLELDGVLLKRAQVNWINEDQLRIILREGKKRQIRRMCELVGLEVVGLKRVRIGKLKLGRLVEGQWRFLLPEESFV